MALRRTLMPVAVLLVCLAASPALLAAQEATPAATAGGFEVWAIDQANTTEEGGGTLYIYPGDALTADAAAASPEVIDLGGAAAALCLEQTGTAPTRPHMLLFNADHSHAILSFVGTGHVLFLDAASRAPLTCLDAGEQAHAAFPTADSSAVVAANQNGKLLQRITTDYATNTFTLDDAATLNLATCTTPSGAPCEDATLRPDNAPICPILDSSSRFAFVTLRGGGLLVVDVTATPMAIVAEYDTSTIDPNGCGGAEANGTIYINSGGGTPANPLESDLYAFPLADFSTTPAAPNTPAPTLVFSHDDRGDVDSHGTVLAGDGTFLWVADRAANLIVVVDTASGEVVNEIVLTGAASDDPAPDLLDVSPDGAWVFAALRGPQPLTANVFEPAINNAVGATPGVGVIQVAEDGRSGELIAVAPITRVVEGAEVADPHALRVRRT